MADITGINLDGIAKINSVIDNWVKEIRSVDTVSTAKQIASAIKGSKKEAEVKALCQSMTSYVQTLTTKLLAYKGRLNEVKNAYMKNDTTASAALSSATQAVKSMKS